MKIEIRIDEVNLYMYNAQGGIRITDKHGNHAGSPTRAKNEPTNLTEWMITNKRI